MSCYSLTLRLCAVLFSICIGIAAPASARDSFGAIAVSPSTLKYGWAADFDTQAAAEAEAVKTCGAKDCKAQTYYWNACGGLAFGDNQSWGSHWAADKKAAEEAAIKACASYGKNCRVERITCSLGPATPEKPGCGERAGDECSGQCRGDAVCQSACVKRKIAECQ